MNKKNWLNKTIYNLCDCWKLLIIFLLSLSDKQQNVTSIQTISKLGIFDSLHSYLFVILAHANEKKSFNKIGLVILESKWKKKNTIKEKLYLHSEKSSRCFWSYYWYNLALKKTIQVLDQHLFESCKVLLTVSHKTEVIQ